jgi:hypothetical protein
MPIRRHSRRRNEIEKRADEENEYDDLTPTMIALKPADSLIPQTSSTVSAATIKNAGRLKTTGSQGCAALSSKPEFFCRRKSVPTSPECSPQTHRA